MPPYRIARAGLGLVPEGRQIFPNLTVRENLMATAANRAGADAWTLDAVLDLFPRLAERACQPGGLLSGGEQQMLAIGRALMTNPRLLILDEATEGLAPLIRAGDLARCSRLKGRGQAILVIDKNIDAADCASPTGITSWRRAQVVWSGASAELRADPEIAHRYLGL